MTPDQIRLVQDSFRKVVPIRAAAAALFYERLFAIDESLRALFPVRDMTKQGAKLMAKPGFRRAWTGSCRDHSADRARTRQAARHLWR